MGKKVTAKTFRKDPLYPRVIAASTILLKRKGYIAPVDLFVEMGLLRDEDLQEWRFGRVPFLEKVIQCNLSKVSRILAILCLHAESSGLKPSGTVYRKWGKGPKNSLRFSKFGDRNIEAAHACHYIGRHLLVEKSEEAQGHLRQL